MNHATLLGLPAPDALPVLDASTIAAIADKTHATLTDLLSRDVLAANTARAYASALRYWDAWHRAALGLPLPLLQASRVAVPPATVRAFVAHHAPELDGTDVRLAMPDAVRERMQQLGAFGARQVQRRSGRIADPQLPSLATIKHRLAALASCHRIAGIEPPWLEDDVLRKALRALGNRVARDAPAMLRKPKAPVERDALTRMLLDCLGDGLVGIRDAALLHCAFHTGGRRRSELVQMRWEDLAPLTLPKPIAGIRDGYLWTLAESKGKRRERADGGVLEIPILGEAADALDRWRDACAAWDIPQRGPVWWRVVRGPKHAPAPRPSTPMIAADVWHMIRRRAERIGMRAEDVGAHSLRSGSTTTFLREGGALADASAMLDHAKLDTTRAFYDHRGVPVEAVVRLLGKGG